jgi:acetolactate synthase I/II/III large subunit
VKVYSALAQAFAAEGVEEVFGVMGDANLHWIDAMSRLGVRTIEARHENAALSMAQGYHRVADKVGVCTTTSGPGVTQLTTSMTIANRARAALVTFSGETPIDAVDHVQYIRQDRVADAMECIFIRAASPKTALAAVQSAFYLARTESRPVLLSAPTDVQQQEIDEASVAAYRPSGDLIRTYRLQPDRAAVAAVADELADAGHVAIVVGRGAVRSRAGAEVLALADRLGAVVGTTMLAKNWLADYEFHFGVSGNYGTRTARRLTAEADYIIAVGTSLDARTTGSGALFGSARIVQIDTAGQSRAIEWGASQVQLQGDARDTLRALLQALGDAPPTAPRGFHTEDMRTALQQAHSDDEVVEIASGLLDPRQVCVELDEIIPDHIGLVLGSGQTAGFSSMLLNRPRDTVLANQFFGSIGQGISAAIGAVVARKNRPCLLVDGDVSFMMYLSEFETAVRYELPLLVVILNDQAMSAEFHKMSLTGLDARLAQLPTPELGKVAVALGGRGVTARSIDQLRTAAREFADDPWPTVIDARISPDVISLPYQRAHYKRDV